MNKKILPANLKYLRHRDRKTGKAWAEMFGATGINQVYNWERAAGNSRPKHEQLEAIAKWASQRYGTKITLLQLTTVDLQQILGKIDVPPSSFEEFGALKNEIQSLTKDVSVLKKDVAAIKKSMKRIEKALGL
jgi:hypothetical protein